MTLCGGPPIGGEQVAANRAPISQGLAHRELRLAHRRHQQPIGSAVAGQPQIVVLIFRGDAGLEITFSLTAHRLGVDVDEHIRQRHVIRSDVIDAHMQHAPVFVAGLLLVA